MTAFLNTNLAATTEQVLGIYMFIIKFSFAFNVFVDSITNHTAQACFHNIIGS